MTARVARRRGGGAFRIFNCGIFCTISKKKKLPIHFISQPGKVYIRNNIARSARADTQVGDATRHLFICRARRSPSLAWARLTHAWCGDRKAAHAFEHGRCVVQCRCAPR